MLIVVSVLLLLLCVSHGLLWREVRSLKAIRRQESEAPVERVRRFLATSKGRDLLRARLQSRGLL